MEGARGTHRDRRKEMRGEERVRADRTRMGEQR